MLNILSVTGPIYLSIGLGYVATRYQVFSKVDGQVLGRFVLNFALPAMLFNALAHRDFSDVINPRYLLAYGLASLMVFGMSLCIWRVVRKKPLAESALTALGMSSSNSGYVGYPILMQVLGPAAGVALALTLLVENLLIIPLALALADSADKTHASWGQTVKHSFLRLTKIPMMWAIVLGFICAMLGVQLPDVLSKTIGMFAVSCAAIALFVNGGSLVGMQVMGTLREVGWIALGKLLLHPWMVGVLIWLFGPVSHDLQIAAVLLSAMPMLGIYPLLAQRYGQQGFCAAALLLTTVASFFSISFILWVMDSLSWLSH
jgi:malonate transporter and related proteins